MNETRALMPEEVTTFLHYAPLRETILCLTGLYFGTRISEALALRFQDVSGAFLVIRSQKYSRNQTFAIPNAYTLAVAALREDYTRAGLQVTDQTYLFVSRQGRNTPITRQQASYCIRQICQRAGIEGCVNTHSFRKTFALTIWKLCEYNLAEVQKYTRHKNIANTSTYVKSAQGTPLIQQLTWGEDLFRQDLS